MGKGSLRDDDRKGGNKRGRDVEVGGLKICLPRKPPLAKVNG